MHDGMIERVAEAANRKRFLARAGAASLAVLAGVLGRSAPAAAFGGQHGCDLCVDPANGCPPSFSCGWCWWGRCHSNNPDGSNKHHNHCCEGYIAGYPCNEACGAGFVCSYYGGRMDGCRF